MSCCTVSWTNYFFPLIFLIKQWYCVHLIGQSWRVTKLFVWMYVPQGKEDDVNFRSCDLKKQHFNQSKIKWIQDASRLLPYAYLGNSPDLPKYQAHPPQTTQTMVLGQTKAVRQTGRKRACSSWRPDPFTSKTSNGFIRSNELTQGKSNIEAPFTWFAEYPH